MLEVWHSLTQAQLFVVTIITTVFGIGALLLRVHIRNLVADKASSEQVGQLEKRMGEMDGQLNAIKEVLKHMPTARDLANLSLSIERLSGTVNTLDAKVVGVRDLLGSTSSKVDRVEDHLLSRG